MKGRIAISLGVAVDSVPQPRDWRDIVRGLRDIDPGCCSAFGPWRLLRAALVRTVEVPTVDSVSARNEPKGGLLAGCSYLPGPLRRQPSTAFRRGTSRKADYSRRARVRTVEVLTVDSVSARTSRKADYSRAVNLPGPLRRQPSTAFRRGTSRKADYSQAVHLPGPLRCQPSTAFRRGTSRKADYSSSWELRSSGTSAVEFCCCVSSPTRRRNHSI